MKEFGRRALALVLAVLLLGLCACSAKTEMVQEETAASEAAAEPAQEAAKPEEAPAAEEPSKNEAADAAAEEQPETVEPETNEATARDPEVRAPIDELPEQEAPAATDAPLTCTISISCVTILEHLDELDPEKVELVPEDGWILAPVTVEFTAGQNVFDVLLETVKANAIHMEYQNTPMYETAYIEGIGNLYEFDCGALSGWMYRVNGWFPNYGCSRYALQAGDVIEWMYTCDLGSDVGGGGVSQGYEE